MDSQLEQQEIGRLEAHIKREKNFRISLIILLVIASFFIVFDRSDTTLKVISFKNTENFELKENHASFEYLKSITKEIINNAFIYSPVTASNNFNHILTLVAPENYGETQKFFQKQLVKIRKNNISSVFFPKEFKANISLQSVIATGTLKTYSGERLVKDETRSIRYDYSVRNFQIYSLGFIDVTGKRDPFLIKLSHEINQ